VNRAAIIAARYAVSSIGLAALAVSATLVLSRETPVDFVVESHLTYNRAFVRDVTVVGSPDYEIVATRIQALEPALQQCVWTTSRITLYAHLDSGVVTNVTAVGDDAERCMTSVMETLTVTSLDEMDVMIPIEVVAIPMAPDS